MFLLWGEVGDHFTLNHKTVKTMTFSAEIRHNPLHVVRMGGNNYFKYWKRGFRGYYPFGIFRYLLNKNS